MKLQIEAISQRDVKWGSKKLGTSSVTIGNYGCYLTCLSMLLKYYGHEQDPEALNELFKSNDVYVQGNLVSGWAVNKVYNDIKYEEHYECPDIPCNLSKIDAYLDKGMPVIAKVDFSPTAGVQDHFVLIIGKENNSYLIADPWTGEVYFFEAKYGDPAKNIYGLRLYSGEVKEVEDDKTKIKDLETQVNALSEQLESTSALVGVLQGDLAKEKTQSGEYKKERDLARGQFRQATWDKEKLEGENKDLKDKLSAREDTVSGLREALKACKSDAVESLSIKDLIVKVIVRLVGR